MEHIFLSLISSFTVIHLKKLFDINQANSEDSHNPSKAIQVKVKRVIRLPVRKMELD